MADSNFRVSLLRPLGVLLANYALASLFLSGGFGLPHDMSPAARKYLDAALEIIQKKALNRDVNWEKMKSDAYAKAANAQKPADTYDAIRSAVDFLKDGHSGFFTAKDIRQMDAGVMKSPGMLVLDCYVISLADKGPAMKAGLKRGMHVLEVDGKPVTDTPSFYGAYWDAMSKGDGRMTLTVEDGHGTRGKYTVAPSKTSVNTTPRGEVLDGRYGYLVVQAFEGSERLQKEFANQIQHTIQGLDKSNLNGWIVDLRLNGGGNMHPMIAGLSSLLGNGDLGSFIGPAENEKWSCRDGKEMVDGKVVVAIKPYHVRNSGLPIAVLVSTMTASSGEAVALSFSGMPKANLIGTPTAGLTTANTFETLSDGAVINLCEAVEADRTGKKYGGPITPTTRVRNKWSLFGSPTDPVIVAAKQWIDGFRAGAN